MVMIEGLTKMFRNAMRFGHSVSQSVSEYGGKAVTEVVINDNWNNDRYHEVMGRSQTPSTKRQRSQKQQFTIECALPAKISI